MDTVVKYNLADEQELASFLIETARLRIHKPMVELKVVRKSRSLSQNSYLHLLLGAFGDHFGYTLEEAKIIYKQINSSTYEYEKKGRTFMRSSADLNTDEMTTTIDKFRRVSAEQGCDLPLATDTDWLRRISNEIEKNKYL